MKTKLTMIGLVMALGGWLAVGGNQNVHPHVRTLEQRVADLEALVVMLSQRLDAQTEQAGTQQTQLERIVPIVNEMEVITMSDGSKILEISNADLYVARGFSQFNDLIVTGTLYHYFPIVQLP